MTGVENVATATVLVSADGSDWRDVSAPLHSLNVEDDDRLTDKAIVRFADTTGLLADASFEGLELRVALDESGGPTFIFEGVVTASRIVATPDHQHVELTALDFTYRMSTTPYDPAEWKAGETLTSVLTRVVGRPQYDITPFQIDPAADIVLDERRPSRPANVNEWEFVLDQAHRQGCLAFLEFDGKDTSNFYFTPLVKIVAAEPVGELHYGRGGGNLIEFCYERSAAISAPRRRAATIDPVTGVRRTSPMAATAPRPPLPPPITGRTADLDERQRTAIGALHDLAATAAATLVRPEERVSGTAALTADELVYRPIADPTSLLGFHGRGRAAGTVALRAKSRVRISGIAAWAEGDWYVRRVNHVYRRANPRNGSLPSYFTEFLTTR
ncbi:hypothetical protein ALI22I_01185 [Saccharothrix sp. ALI-22-I]|uniref:hypothetical protein n=1 Tax=Saccharothrix sp. ALI-22-I TaxID=1933778 RepID=UPI00097BDC16|nr:hypothetical protein [Saccharothrix sp. ALI-22-I]ONI92917.1 hypothetical protein ALI22I_01185 [Saccharothrix sp. ALI-22-I]